MSMELLDEKFHYPPEPCPYGEELVGKRISIYWKGDDLFYPGIVKKYDASKDRHIVLYENDFTGKEYAENLRKQIWKMWIGTEEEYVEIATQIFGTVVKYEPEPPIVKKTKIPTYTAMVVEAVIELNEKEGSSLNAIRKYILTYYDISNKQKASFNSLTLKAANRCVASGELEKVKHSFKLSAAEKDRRRGKFSRDFFDYDEDFAPDDKRLLSYGIDSATYSSILARNKHLRKLLVELKNNRDSFLKDRLYLLKYFLPEQNYFNRAEREAAAAAAAAAAEAMNGQGDSSMNVDNVPTEENREALVNKSADESMMESEGGWNAEDNPILDETMDDEQVEELNESKVLADQSTDDLTRAKTIGKDEISPLEIEETEESFVEEEATPEENLPYSTLDGVNTIEIPKILTADLHDHQVTGISWMSHMFHHGMPMILGDQMGLGKTIQTIGFLAHLYEHHQMRGPHLIVVPLSVLSNWLAEIERFCPTLRAVRFHGPKVERERIKEEELRDYTEFEIVVTTFEILVSEINFFRRRFVWTTVIIDEGHRLKNEKSQLSEKLRLVPSIGKIILTGTPLQNNLHELWALLYYLSPDIFTSSKPFDEGFDLTRGKIDNRILRKARRMLSVFMLRRLKDQVAIKLPSRKEVTLLVSLTEQQTDLYRQLLCGLDSNTIEVVMREAEKADKAMSRASSMIDLKKTSSTENITTVKNPEEGEATNNAENTKAAKTETAVTTSNTSSSTAYASDSDWRKLMNILLQLRKICNHTYLLPHVAPDPYEVTEEIVSGSGKLLMLDRMLPALRADGHRVLIFSQFTSMLDILEDYCEFRDYPYVRLDGETNRVKRRLDVRRYNADHSNLFIFLISTRAGGLGLNLATADTVILYDSDWNPQVDLQAMERAHRIGQKKPVRVFRLICRGSVEERMISRAEKKLFLNAMVAEMDPDQQLAEHHGGENDPGEVMEALGIGGGAMSKGELASLIRFGANAVFESENSLKNQLSDEELFELLERQGRDKPIAPKVSTITSTHNENSVVESSNTPNEEDVFEKAQAVLKDRMELLQEVDLRQLGNVIYTKKKPDRKSNNVFDTNEILTEKRQRKERIVMVNGKGTGYGGAVPILSENMETDGGANTTENDEVGWKTRGRQWVHRDFCTLCGKKKDRERKDTANIKCAHCPFLFHQLCTYDYDIFSMKGTGMFICPHHRCIECNRSTAAAGGLLFRCLNCLTAYCEDCLPQDEIESVGRCRALESYGYHSKQAYYIKCPACCNREGCKPSGVLGDQNQEEEKNIIDEDPEARKGQDDNNQAMMIDEKDGGEEAQRGPLDGAENALNQSGEVDEGLTDGLLPTQYALIHWHEIVPPPRPPGKKSSKKRKRASKGGGRSAKKTPSKKGEVEDEGEEEEVEGSEEEVDDEVAEKEEEGGVFDEIVVETFAHPKVPKSLTYESAFNLFQSDPNLKQLFSLYDRISEIKREEDPQNSHKYSPFDSMAAFSTVTNKLEAGRYRAVNLFYNDINYVLENQVVKKILKLLPSLYNKTLKKAIQESFSSLMEEYLKEEILPVIQV